MRHHLNRRVIFSAAIAALAASPALSHAATINQTFDAGPGDFVAGPGGPANYGWLNEDLTLGTSGPGEIGGTMTQTPTEVWMADPTIGPGGVGAGLLSLDDPIAGSGEFYIGNQSSHTNGAVFIGHMTTAFGDGNELGIQYSDGGGNRGTFWLGFKSSSQTGNGEPTRGTVVPNPAASENSDVIRLPGERAYTFTYNYDPTTRLLSAEVFDQVEGLSRGTASLTIGAGVTANFTAWGAEQAGIQGSSDLRLDNVTYTTGVAPPTPTWNQPSGGSWLNTNNWLAGILPNGEGAVALFGSSINADRTVYADSPVTLGSVTFDNANMYVLSGAGSFTLDGAGSGAADVNVLQGTHKINLPLVIASNTTLDVADGATLLVSDPVTVNANVNVTKSGTGTVTYQSTIDLADGATIVFDSSQHVAALTVGDNGRATLAANSGRVLQADTLNISATGGKLDLTDNKMIFRGQGPGTFTGGAYDGPAGLVDRGRGVAGNAQWDGSGIVTSDTRAINNGDLVSIGVAKVSEVRNVTDSQTTTFGGEVVSGSDTIAMATWGGDANLDGKINIDDYGRIDGNVGQSGSVFGWSKGDFNYDGKINIDDYGIIDGNINRQGAAFTTAGEAVGGVAAVPEPAGVAMVASLALGTMLRRRRK